MPHGKRTRGFALVTGGEITCPRCAGTGKIAPDTVSIGDRMRFLRETVGKTQEEVSPHLHVSRAQLANIEGDRSRPGIEILVAAAKLFGTTTDYILGLETSK